MVKYLDKQGKICYACNRKCVKFWQNGGKGEVKDEVVEVVLDSTTYPYLAKYTTPVKRAEREIVGRDKEINRLMAAILQQ